MNNFYWISWYTLFLLLCLRVWQVYCIENLHLLGHHMTATVPGEAVEEVLSLGSCNCMFLIQTVP